MTYQETIDYLYQQLPVFHRIGKVAFKADLSNTTKLCEHLNNPHRKFRTIHIAGTNGKGSSSHYVASILQSAGYKTGLYTSPHLKSFTERIRINGQPIPEQAVVEFVENNQEFLEELNPSFFEMSVGMAFEYFEKENVDIAVIEVGLGGRLDSTNIITPIACLITNISFDHVDILGDTLEKIASEKAGIIKSEVPVVISEKAIETQDVFIQKATLENAPIYFAEEHLSIKNYFESEFFLNINIWDKSKNSTIQLSSQLLGKYQLKNILGVLKLVDVLNQKGFQISNFQIQDGISKVISQTGLKGRWQVLSKSPLMICDTAHNVSGISQVLESIKKIKYQKIWMILGFVSDKDISSILQLLPKDANYIFCEANIPRAMRAADLRLKALEYNLVGEEMKNVNQAIQKIKILAKSNDLIYIGGSTFVVAEIDML